MLKEVLAPSALTRLKVLPFCSRVSVAIGDA